MDDNYLGRKLAFDVGEPPEYFDFDDIPTCGIEYLYKVKLEERRCPSVVVSDIDTKKYAAQQNITFDEPNGFISARPGFEPDPEWQRKTLKKFISLKRKMFEYRSDLKKKFERKTFPHADKFEEWCVYCLGLDKYRVLYGEVESETSYDTKAAEDSKKGVKSMIRKGDIEPHQPLLSIVLHMRRRHVIRVLMYHIAWMEVLGFSHCQGEWLYALLVALDTPLYPDTCAMIRNLSRLCSKLRSELTSPKDKFLKPLNMILSIISVYFDQKDMSDNFMEY